jgi:hypothetical protein
MTHPRLGNLMAITIAVLAVWAIATRVQIDLADNNDSYLASAWALMRYFTVLTNALVAVVLVLHVFATLQSASRLAGTTLAISIVGVVFHLLLADLVELEGIEVWVDLAFHTLVPLLTFAWWAVFAPKSPMTPLTPLTWLIWPAVYAVYAVGRGIIDGEYPYFFVNLDELGWIGLTVSLAQFLIAFAIAGYLLWALAKLLARLQSAKPG